MRCGVPWGSVVEVNPTDGAEFSDWTPRAGEPCEHPENAVNATEDAPGLYCTVCGWHFTYPELAEDLRPKIILTDKDGNEVEGTVEFMGGGGFCIRKDGTFESWTQAPGGPVVYETDPVKLASQQVATAAVFGDWVWEAIGVDPLKGLGFDE